jgi:membrane-bound lytic murein transglycosylase B
MAMKQVMTIERARELAAQIARAYSKFGAQTSVPYSVTQLTEIIAVLSAHGNYDGPTKEDLNKVTRQLTACQAREAGLRKQLKDG